MIMTYHLTITKLVPNPDYNAEEARRCVNFGYSQPSTIPERVLDVEVSEDEFKAIKKATLEVI